MTEQMMIQALTGPVAALALCRHAVVGPAVLRVCSRLDVS